MNFRVDYVTGQTYQVSMVRGKVEISKFYNKALEVQFESDDKSGKPFATLGLTVVEAERLAYALLLAKSAAYLEPIKYSFDDLRDMEAICATEAPSSPQSTGAGVDDNASDAEPAT